MAKAHLLSLGCPKNLVDSRTLLRTLGDRGIDYAEDPAESDILIVNTCGFIEAAKKESVDEILRIASYKEGAGKRLVVFGCLAKRYGRELKEEIPEIDALFGVGEEERIADYCVSSAGGIKDVMPGLRAGAKEPLLDKPYGYLKIAEGCDRSCTYCVIPGIRGRFRSRRPEEILSDAGVLLGSGVKELIVVAQDITSYGRDIGSSLDLLVREIASLKGDFRIRLLYLFPTSVDDRLLETIRAEEKVCAYFDMPLQHSEEKVLRLMGRAGGRDYYKRLIGRIRETVPEAAIRTTMIVGFPGETDADFSALLDFVSEMRFERLGVFTYSREEGTPAAAMKEQVSKRIKHERYEEVMRLQSGISLEHNRGLLGKRLRVLVDETEEGVSVARLGSQAPEIDGVVIIKDTDLKKGDFADVVITAAYDYDLDGNVAG